MRTGGGYSRFNGEEQDEGDDYQARKDRINKTIEKDRKIIEGAQKANEPLYRQIDVSSKMNSLSFNSLSNHSFHFQKHSSDNEYMKHIQKQRSKQNLEQSS